MSLISIFCKECVETGFSASSKDDVLKKIASLSLKSEYLTSFSEEEIFKALLEREKTVSTGIGNGIAIPHCRIKGLKDFVLGVLTLEKGVDYDSIDGKDVDLFVFIIAPAEKTNEHIKLLSKIAQFLHKKGVADEIRQCPDNESINEIFKKYSTPEKPLKSEEYVHSDMIFVFVQDENYFRDILQVFSGLNECSLMVVDSQNESAYLSQIPLFAGFWNDDFSQFSKIIVAVVRRSSTNDVVRSINEVSGGLDKNGKILVAVINLFYSAGSIQY